MRIAGFSNEVGQQGSKPFFFEKKKQKTFDCFVQYYNLNVSGMK
jgi:hypothetical protein